MSPIRIYLFLLFGLVCCSLVLAQRGRGGYGRGRGGGGFYGGMGSFGGGGRYGGRRYRSTLHNDDDVYGYEATYPGGEAMYINYRNSEARAKRGQEFARSSPYSSSGGFKSEGGQMGYHEQSGRDERNANPDPMW